MAEKISEFVQSLHGHAPPLKKILLVLLVISLITIPDLLLEILIQGHDALFTLAHYAFEGFELLLEEILQHVFHLDKNESQLYVFYLLIAMAGGLIFAAVRMAPSCYRRLVQACRDYYVRKNQYLKESWDNMPWLQRVLLFTFYLPLFLYLCSFLIM